MALQGSQCSTPHRIELLTVLARTSKHNRKAISVSSSTRTYSAVRMPGKSNDHHPVTIGDASRYSLEQRGGMGVPTLSLVLTSGTLEHAPTQPEIACEDHGL